MKVDIPSDSPPPKESASGAWQKTLFDALFVGVSLSALPLALTDSSWNLFGFRDGLLVLGSLLVMAVGGAGLLAVILRLFIWPEISRPLDAARLGARGGTLVLLLGGGIFVLIATLNHLRWISNAAVDSHPFHLWLVLSLCFVPVVTAASASAAVFSRILLPQSSRKETVVVHPAGKSRNPVGILYLIALIVGIVCLLTPSLLPWIPAKKVAAPVSTSIPGAESDQGEIVEKPNDLVVGEAPFFYTQPIEFDTAPAYRWNVLARKELEDIRSSGPVAMSTEGRFLAYVSRNDSALVIIDLDRFAIHSTYPGIENLEQIAWSPESDLLFCLTRQERPFSFLIRVAQQVVLPLPLVAEASVPLIQPFWWEDFEVAFFPDSGSRLYLDLARLRLRPIDESHRWGQLTGKSSNPTISTPQLQTVQSTRCRLTASPRITAYRRPGFQQEGWVVDSNPVLSLADKKVRHLRSVPATEINTGDRIVSAERSMKVVRLRDDGAEVIYFSLEENASSPFVACELPEHFDPESQAGFAEALEEHTACAFVCAPRVNPLTGKTVGPDREKVRALVRWLEASSEKAKFWIAEHYEGIEPGDVVADIHRWGGGRVESLPSSLPEHWFAEIRFPELKEDAESSVTDLGTLDRKSRAEFSVEKGWQRLEEFVYPVSLETTSAPEEGLSSVADAVEPAEKKGAVAEQEPVPEPKVVEDRIRAFVRDHYRKLERKDLAGYLGDYSDFIVYEGKPQSRSETLRSSVAGAMRSQEITVELSDRIEVNRVPGETPLQFSVSFVATIKLSDATGSERILGGSVRLAVFPLGEEFRIVSERSSPSR